MSRMLYVVSLFLMRSDRSYHATEVGIKIYLLTVRTPDQTPRIYWDGSWTVWGTRLTVRYLENHIQDLQIPQAAQHDPQTSQATPT